MLKSMTAYSFVEEVEDDVNVAIEMRTYNSRHLDMALRLPMGYASYEEKIKELVSAVLVRGRVEVRLTVKDASKRELQYEAEPVRAKAYLDACKQLMDDLHLSAAPLSVEHLLNVPGMIQPSETQPDIDAYWPVIAAAVQKSTENVDRMRQKEGDFIRKDFDQRLDHIEQKLNEIEKSVQDLPEKYRNKLHARVEALTKGVVELDPARIAQEACLLAERADISEEIVRSKSHIKQFKSIMGGDEPAGRKLNFLLQEFNREFNTMGAKVGQATAAHMIVDVKSEIEKLREQVQNIE